MPSLAQARRGLALGAIAGLGVYRPPADAQPARRITGADLTGVSYRVQSDQGVSTPALAAGAARAALRVAGVRTSDIEMIIVGTTTPDVLWPTTACLVQTELKLPMVASFDLYAAETSVLSALNVGIRYVTAGARAVLLIGAESDNQLVDLPGQGGRVHSRGAAAVLLTPADDDRSEEHTSELQSHVNLVCRLLLEKKKKKKNRKIMKKKKKKKCIKTKIRQKT